MINGLARRIRVAVEAQVSRAKLNCSEIFHENEVV